MLPALGELLAALLEVARPRGPRGAVNILQQLEWLARARGHLLGLTRRAPIGRQRGGPPSRW